jgi:parallel beta-helix repeat protein
MTKTGKRIGELTLLATFFFAGLLLAMNFSINARNVPIHDPGRTALTTTTMRESTSSVPILIVGNTQLQSYCAANGSGSGTVGTPYLIKDLVISGGNTRPCFEIRDTNKYMRFENCTFSNGKSSGAFCVKNCTNLNITKCRISTSDYGVYLYNSINNAIYANNITGGSTCIGISGAKFGKISDNVLNNSVTGVTFSSTSSNFTMTNNKINNCLYGMQFSGAKSMWLFNNLFKNCSIGISTSGFSASDYANYKIDTSNLVNSKPIYYCYSKTNLAPAFFSNAGAIILIKCTNISITGLSMPNASITIQAFNTANLLIQNVNCSIASTGFSLYNCSATISTCTITGTFRPIALNQCHDLNIHDNSIAGTTYQGMEMFYIFQSIFERNEIENCYVAMSLSSGFDITFVNNQVNGNDYGLLLAQCSNLTVTGNTMANNTYNALSIGFCDQISIIGNHLVDNEYGISLSSSVGNTVRGNDLQQNGYGIELHDADNNIIESNDFLNDGWAFYIDAGKNNHISGNNLSYSWNAFYTGTPAPNFVSNNWYLFEDDDQDGLINLAEFQNHTDPSNPDSDFDGLNDGLEIHLGTDPNNPDTDGDGFRDGFEYNQGSNPLDPSSKPANQSTSDGTAQTIAIASLIVSGLAVFLLLISLLKIKKLSKARS